MCIHNDESEQFWVDGLSWVYKFGNGRRLYVSPFQNLIDAIYDHGRGWRPE
jgi:hypothetical protein